MSTSSDDRPDLESSSYLHAVDRWGVVRNVLEGTARIREQASRYLPRHEAEDWRGYTERVNRAVVFNGLQRTVDGLTGLLVRNRPAVSEAVLKLANRSNGAVSAHLANIDLAGRDLMVFTRDLARDVLTDGFACILVDAPKPDPGVRSILDAQRAGIRPYWLNIPRGDVINWRSDRRRGHEVLTMVVIRSDTVEPEGEFSERQVERVTVYRLVDEGVRWEVWTRDQTGEREWKITEDGTISALNRIPLVVVYAPNRTGVLEADPPLEDLAHLNIEHVRVSSDRQRALHIASCPIPVIFGYQDDGEIIWGPDRALMLPATAKVQFLEPSGGALPESREELRLIESRMSALGAQMLIQPARAVESATAKLVEKSERDSALAGVARGIERGLNEALELHAKFMGLEVPEDAGISLTRDFSGVEMDPQMVSAISKAVASGQLSLETFWDVLNRGEIVSIDDPTLELERIQSDFPMPG
jgi:hypothetical protein